MKKLFLVLAAVGVLIGSYVVAERVWEEREKLAIEQKKDDQQVSRDVNRELPTHLAELNSEHPIRQRYGKLVELRGEEYHRLPGLKPGPHLMPSRMAVFEKASVLCEGTVMKNDPPSVSVRMSPSKEWTDKNPTAKLKKNGGVLAVTRPGITSRTSVDFGVTHPRCFYDQAHLLRNEKIGQELNQAIAALTAEVTQAEAARHSGTR